MDIKIALTSEKSKAPYKEPDSVGYDVFSYGDHILNVNETKIIPLGFHMALPQNHGAFIWDRSSFGSKGIHVFRQLIENPAILEDQFRITPFGGVIDFGYRGQMGVILHNFSNKLYAIKHHDRIAQMVVQKCEDLPLTLITMEELLKIPSMRGMKGLGTSDGQNTEASAQAAIAGAATSINSTGVTNTVTTKPVELTKSIDPVKTPEPIKPIEPVKKAEDKK